MPEAPTRETGHRGLEGGLVEALAFSPDGARLASGGGDRIINIWDVPSRSILATLAGSGDQIRVLAFSPDRRRLFSGDRSGTLASWELGFLPRR